MDPSQQAAADEAFLAKRLGARFGGLEFDGEGFVVTVFQPTGKRIWYEHATPEGALAAARRDIEPVEGAPSCPSPSTQRPAATAAPGPASSTTGAAATQTSLPMPASTSGGSLVAPQRPPRRGSSRSSKPATTRP